MSGYLGESLSERKNAAKHLQQLTTDGVANPYKNRPDYEAESEGWQVCYNAMQAAVANAKLEQAAFDQLNFDKERMTFWDKISKLEAQVKELQDSRSLVVESAVKEERQKIAEAMVCDSYRDLVFYRLSPEQVDNLKSGKSIKEG